MKKGRALPSWFLEEPILSEFEQCVLVLHNKAQTLRRFQSGPIPWTELLHMLEQHGLSGVLLHRIILIIYRLDDLYLVHVAKTRELAGAK